MLWKQVEHFIKTISNAAYCLKYQMIILMGTIDKMFFFFSLKIIFMCKKVFGKVKVFCLHLLLSSTDTCVSGIHKGQKKTQNCLELEL